MNNTQLKQLKQLKDFLLKLKSKITSDSDLQTLVYALGLINKRIFTGENNLKHVAIIGPTQAGKSTLVNLLLGTKKAKVSTRAAFTRRAYGFTQSKVDKTLEAYVHDLFSYDDSPVADNNAVFSLEQIQSSKLTNSIVWDTADFDSVAAVEYKESTLMLYALADIVVLVVSKEKYADLAVWQTLRLGKNSNRPLLVFVNKVDAANEIETIQIVQNKFSKENIKTREIYALPYVSKDAQKSLQEHSAILSAREFINTNVQNQDHLSDNLKDFLNSHWVNWTYALEQEITAHKIWQQNVDKVLKVAADSYAKDYLQNSIYGETMQQIMLRLLELLEIPKLANTLGKLRSVITWPARTLFNSLKSQIENKDSLPSSEELVLRELYENSSASLLRKIGDQALVDDVTKVWWQELWQVFKTKEEKLSTDYKLQIKKHQLEFAPEIIKAAEDVYQGIKTQPMTLNSLRVARASADAVAVIFALKTGGIGAHDLFLTPAMLAFTTLITESAVGHYLKKAEAKLKAKQAESVADIIFEHYKNRLLLLPDKIPVARTYAISQDDLSKMQKLVQDL